MSYELKPCPFCGCQMRIKSNRDTHQLWGDHAADCVFESTEHTGQEYFGTDSALTWLIDSWNRRAPVERQAPEWMPIETAPKDGTIIMLARGERVTCGNWWEEESYIHEHRDEYGNYTGQTEFDGIACWMSADGGFTDDDPPTHWMPIHAAPSAQGRSEG